MNAWSLLPNAHHIDWVIQSLTINYPIWDRAHETTYNAICSAALSAAYDSAWDVGWDRTRDAAHNAIRSEILYAALDATHDAISDAVLGSAWAIQNAAYNAARDTLLTLIAYDDCGWYLAMTYEQLLTYAALSDKPQALLLLSMKWVQEHESLVTAP